MANKTYKLGELIELSNECNSELKYGIDDVCGMTIEKTIIPTKADMNETDVSKFYIVRPNEFIYNPRTHGKKIGLGFNDTGKSFLISWNNAAFGVKETAKKLVVPKYLFMNFNRPEWDRKACRDSWGTSTEVFSWNSMCDMDITLPDITIQQKYVDIYDAMAENLKSYEKWLDDLKLTCDAYIEDLRRKMPSEKIGKYIRRYSEKNTDKAISDVVGLSTTKQFRIAQSRVNREELGGYKILHNLDIAFVSTTDSWKVLAFAVNHFEKDVVVSPIYEVFNVSGKLNPDYLAIWLKRKEFDRYARYNSWGTTRENFPFEEMQNVQIPIPNEKIQQSIIDLYIAFEVRKSIAEKLRTQIKGICPILIKGSLEESRLTN